LFKVALQYNNVCNAKIRHKNMTSITTESLDLSAALWLQTVLKVHIFITITYNLMKQRLKWTIHT